MKRSTLLLLLALVIVAGLAKVYWPTTTSTQAGYAGLGEQASGFAQAGPGQTLRFPGDHGPHPDYRIEWWYLTANLESADGRPFGVQWTLFRQALAPEAGNRGASAASPWQDRQLWMAHAAVSTPQGHRFAEKFARGMALPAGQGQAGVTAAPFAAWIDDWSLVADEAESGLDRLTVHADADDFAYRLALTAQGPLVRHGEGGFSQKSADGQGSMYYSQPFYRVEGTLRLDEEPFRVTGRAWLDREWSSQLLGRAQHGWDWFSLHLGNGAKLMAFRLRGGGEGEDDAQDYLSGSWITPQGEVSALAEGGLRLTPVETRDVAGRELPTTWRVEVPDRRLDVTVSAIHPDQWMGTSFPYWEGMVTVRGSHAGKGYLEMTGY
ncbi:putative secreted hydrolase [Modicisalibacter xianhensis]|uniref:Putative secreted hydrolase n=1 Tax=Modicisalibacter xianhensis TaxID=442341 RepID=A0A4R8FVJ4_9GAMM|nr:lipocalin-like domain-containing protein [Halomonas xianhensis]TDX29557.1 putative secreted hydrolase [Halomonas xianhensis]